MRQKHQQNLDDADMAIENLKKQLGPKILEMTMGELRKHKLYHDIEDTVGTNMNELNMTIKEKIHQHDDGMNTININLCVFGSMVPFISHAF